ncbi:MAG: alpha/beta hydrolase, partial [Chitinophagaceae bacterium]
MKKDILLIHGAGEETYDWTMPFVGSLKDLKEHYRFRFPKMPDAGNPNYTKWK